MPGAWTLTSRVVASSALLYGMTRTNTFKQSILNQKPHFKLTTRRASSTAMVGSVMALVSVARKPLGLPDLSVESEQAKAAREATPSHPRQIKKTRQRATIV